jgi:hypothetical protein
MDGKNPFQNGYSWSKDGEIKRSIVRNHSDTMYCHVNEMAFHFKVTFFQIPIHILAAVLASINVIN